MRRLWSILLMRCRGVDAIAVAVVGGFWECCLSVCLSVALYIWPGEFSELGRRWVLRYVMGMHACIVPAMVSDKDVVCDYGSMKTYDSSTKPFSRL
jgi:hypothetical protein